MTYQGWRNDSSRGAAIYATYLEKITKFVLWLLDRGHPVRILTGEITDRQAVADLARKVAAARPHLPQDRFLAEPISSLHSLMREIAKTDIVVATRFHNVVCALKLCKPTVSIGYGQKNGALMAEMGVGRFCQHIERLDLDLLIDQFKQLISDRRSYEQSIRDANLVYRERLEHQDSVLESRLL
jgi:polysaccharide pyruvyl transferase WcaK-like protein